MADDTTKIQSNYQTFLTEQDPDGPSRFQNSDLPTSDSIRFIQFCALMGAPQERGGFGLEVFNTIADQALAIMVSREGTGRKQVVDVSSSLTREKYENWRYGPQGRPVEEATEQPKARGRRK